MPPILKDDCRLDGDCVMSNWEMKALLGEASCRSCGGTEAVGDCAGWGMVE